jgi:hypothetical protein
MASLKSLQQDEAEVGRLKRETRLCRQIDCRPSLPFATLAARSTLAISYLPKGAKGPGTDAQPSCRSTDDAAPVGAREPPRAHRAKTPRHNPRHSRGGQGTAGVARARLKLRLKAAWRDC